VLVRGGGDRIWNLFFHKDCPINGVWLSFIAMILTLTVYTLVSLATSRNRKANLEKLLHRGPYAIPSDQPVAKAHSTWWLRLAGITEHFTLFDKILAIGLLIWQFGWFAVFLSVTAYHFAFGSDDFFIIGQLPDNAAAAALALSTSSSGAVHTRTIALLTPEELDAASRLSPTYRAPGS